ncbi:hypothetical protein [Bradyrhizobium elkanii]|uniref:hypothetical protein n=1 Tax=Bradyrhizobium elkanii TaxID=29448 RepID=UPI0012FE793A|nr:hypothetical protein [Bradyrhizobium elkanii]
MTDHSSRESDLMSWLLAIDDRDERAWHILDFGLVHDPAYADTVAVAAAGPGVNSRRLSAMIGAPDEDVERADISVSVAPPSVAAPGLAPIGQERSRVNPFHRSES